MTPGFAHLRRGPLDPRSWTCHARALPCPGTQRPQRTGPAPCVVAAGTVPHQLPLRVGLGHMHAAHPPACLLGPSGHQPRLDLVCGPSPFPSVPLATLLHRPPIRLGLFHCELGAPEVTQKNGVQSLCLSGPGHVRNVCPSPRSKAWAPPREHLSVWFTTDLLAVGCVRRELGFHERMTQSVTRPESSAMSILAGQAHRGCPHRVPQMKPLLPLATQTVPL